MSYELDLLLRAVTKARSTLKLTRPQGSSKVVPRSEQQELLAALEAYAVALTSHGHPMPHHMRSELAMYRAMCAPPGRRTR